MSCGRFLQCILKLLNIFLTFVGAAMVLYSLWMLNEWHKNAPLPAPAPAPVETYESMKSAKASMDGLNSPLLPQQMEGREFKHVETVSFIIEQVTKSEFGAKDVFPDSLPAPWFIYGFLGAGIFTCLIACIGHIAIETTSSCCLSCYTLLLGLLLLLQAAITATVLFDHHWREDIPKDPTGELDRIYSFVEENYDICKWVGVAVLFVEALALLFSFILRAILDPRKLDYDSDDDYLPRAQRQALLNRQPTAAAGSAGSVSIENRPVRNDEWSKRMREKYGVDTSEFTYNPSESRRFAQQGATVPTGEEKKGRCSIM